MGSDSGSGGGSDSISDNRELENLARKELQKPIPKARKRVFLSFKGEDKSKVDLLRGQVKNENSELDFIDYSLRVPFNSENAEYIKRGIRERIERSSVTMVCLTKDTHKSEWVDWEIRESKRQGKKVVGVKMDEGPIEVPKAIKENGCKVVNWNHKEINQAINS